MSSVVITNTTKKFKVLASLTVMILIFILGIKTANTIEEIKRSLKSSSESLQMRFRSDPREECLRELFLKEEDPSIWKIRRCSKLEKKVIL